MNWLTNWMMREGPGIPKNAPKKKGLALFAFILVREAWDLFKLNLLILVFSIPVITAPAALVAGMSVTRLMIDDENVWLWRDFQRAFRRHFWAATLWGLGFAVVLGLSTYAVYIYGQLARHAFLYVMPVAVAVCVMTFIAMTAICLFSAMAGYGLSGGRLFRVALLAALAKPLPVLAGLAFTLALWLLHVAFYPVTVFMPVIFNFSLGALAMAFGAHKATAFAFERAAGRPDSKILRTAQMRP
ncbi:YesL family protein [Martelella endophytica]|uniref:YesL family protein n=1 Tax=Martelella endophytica TaxID=1486262 RepID=UPI000698008E|nr:YesL family protein [Martelella endophytica]